MRLLRRLTAAFAGLLLLQLALLGSGTLCGMRAGADGGMAGHAMAGMTAMPDAPAPAGHPAPADCGGNGSGDDCRLPWSSGACAAMTGCLAVVAPAAPGAPTLLVAQGAPRAAEPARIQSGPPLAPELPPPRA